MQTDGAGSRGQVVVSWTLLRATSQESGLSGLETGARPDGAITQSMFVDQSLPGRAYRYKNGPSCPARAFGQSRAGFEQSGSNRKGGLPEGAARGVDEADSRARGDNVGPKITLPASDYLTASTTKKLRLRQVTTPILTRGRA